MSSNRPVRYAVLTQWVLLLVTLGCLASAAIWSDAMWRVNAVAYDVSVPRGVSSDDLVIVALDDASVAELGRWPWRRAVLALGLNRIARAAPRGVLLDVLFLEPDDAGRDDDAALAAAIARAAPTVLPLALGLGADGQLSELLPIEPLRGAATGLGHAHLELDRDGIARSVFLREGLHETRWPHLALAMLDALGERYDVAWRADRSPLAGAASSVWSRDYRVLIPFLGPPGTVKRVSFAELLRGNVPDSELAGRIVLIGATAQGLGDAYPTSGSRSGTTMAGVEVSANVLAMLRAGTAMQRVPVAIEHLLAWLFLGVVFLGFLRLTPRASLLLVFTMLLVLPVAAAIGLRATGWWWPATPALAALLVAYPLWSWRRLEATQRYLQEEFARLEQRPSVLPPLRIARSTDAPVERFGDVIQQRIDLARYTVAEMRRLRRFLAGTVASLPDATLVVTAGGEVLLANAVAADLFGVADAQDLQGTGAASIAAPYLRGETESLNELISRAPCAVETHHADGREFLVRVAPLADENGATTASIIELVNVSMLKRALREREDLIRFISHDLRSPASSLLALAGMQRDPSRALQPAEFVARTESLAKRSLALAEGFLALAHAEAIAPQTFVVFDLIDAVRDARDEVWAWATEREIRLQFVEPAESAWVCGSRELISRAIINLLSNAVKYSAIDSSVNVRTRFIDDAIEVRVTDAGPGIDNAALSVLFQRFARLTPAVGHDPGGIGLGLAFVKLVAERHGGSVGVDSEPGRGSAFYLRLPRASMSADLDEPR